jgi:hypothetical protein
MTAASVAVYSLYNLASYTPVDKKAYSAGGFASAGLPYTQALGVNQDNIMISKGFYIDGSDYATIWTGVTEDYEFRLESVTEVSGASGIAPSSGSTNIVFNSSPATSKTGFTMASAAFG